MLLKLIADSSRLYQRPAVLEQHVQRRELHEYQQCNPQRFDFLHGVYAYVTPEPSSIIMLGSGLLRGSRAWCGAGFCANRGYTTTRRRAEFSSPYQEQWT